MSNSSILIGVARSDAFAGRIAIRALSAAVAVANEAAITPDHAARVKYAALHLRGDANNKVLSGVVLTNPTIAAAAIADAANNGAAVLDADIDFQLASVWTAMGNALV